MHQNVLTKLLRSMVCVFCYRLIRHFIPRKLTCKVMFIAPNNRGTIHFFTLIYAKMFLEFINQIV